MEFLRRVFPWFQAAAIAGGLVLLLVVCVWPGLGRAPRGGWDWEGLRQVPVSADGRVKPLDTFARNSLMSISGKQTVREGERTIPAIEWLVEVMADPNAADTRRVFRIDHPDLVAMLGVKDASRVRFSYAEMSDHLDEIARQADLAAAVPAKSRDPFQRQVLDLANRLRLYSGIARLESPYMVAPRGAGTDWDRLLSAVRRPDAMENESLRGVVGIIKAAAEKKEAELNTEVANYLAWTGEHLAGESVRVRCEVVFNRVEPFYVASTVYVWSFLLACVGFLLTAMSRQGWARSLLLGAVLAMGLAFVVHTAGIVARIYLQGRPPVTNLYSSAVFIGWACVPVSMFIERVSRLGIGYAAGSLIGFATLVVAHNLAGGGDTMEMMQAVLDTNFWLSTHVVVVTIGYSSTFLAGFLAAGYLIFGVLTPWLRGEGMKALPKMVYGVICFASITSFVGTVLGGIWADQSWGRFWGWDPKENGAALIVLANLLILHARWGGMIRERGVAVLAVFGNIVTAWSWFGTNMLGVGLHSYGFMDSAVFWLASFCGLQLAIMALGLVPTARWRSVRAMARAGGSAREAPAGGGGASRPVTLRR